MITPREHVELDEALEPVQKLLTKDIRAAAITLGDTEARFLVDAYYIIQDDRKRADAQERALDTASEPNAIIAWFGKQNSTLEEQIKVALDSYTKNHMMGSWMRDVYGIGPVLSAGLLAHIYMGLWCTFAHDGQMCRGRNADDCAERQKDKKDKLGKVRKGLPEHKFHPDESCPTVGHIWQFAGIAGDGQKPWEKGTKRPHNAKLKTLCWKIGQSFMKFSNAPDCVYGKVYRDRKAEEVENNETLKYATQAAKKATQVGKATEAYKYYSIGKLSPGHINQRALRYAVKWFLADMHGEWYRRTFGKEPPLPYPIAILGHAHRGRA